MQLHGRETAISNFQHSQAVGKVHGSNLRLMLAVIKQGHLDRGSTNRDVRDREDITGGINDRTRPHTLSSEDRRGGMVLRYGNMDGDGRGGHLFDELDRSVHGSS